MKSALDELNAEQRAAVVQFRERFGRSWKAKLMDGWLRAAYPGALQSIRNEYGPEWLTKVRESDFEGNKSVQKLRLGRPKPSDPHRPFFDAICAGGRVWRDDPQNNVQEWLDLEKLGGDPSEIRLYGFKNLSLTGPQILPEMCFIFLADAEPGCYVRAVRRGESGNYATTYDVADPEKAKGLVVLMNRKLGVSHVQAECMLAGSMFGWDSPGADPVRMQKVFTEHAEALGFSSAEEMFENQRLVDKRQADFAAAMAYQQSPEAAQRIAAAAEKFGIPESSFVFVEPPEEAQQEDEKSEYSCRP